MVTLNTSAKDPGTSGNAGTAQNTQAQDSAQPTQPAGQKQSVDNSITTYDTPEFVTVCSAAAYAGPELAAPAETSASTQASASAPAEASKSEQAALAAQVATSASEPAALAAVSTPESTAQDDAAMANGNESADNYTGLQTLIDAALAKVTGKLTGRIKVVLAQNTTYDGDVNINAGARDVAVDFELELSAEDAGEDGMDGAGATIVNGKITIKGIKVIMNSVMMAAGKAIVVQNAGADAGAKSSRGGALVYNGTQNMPSEITVEVGNNSSAEINTLGGADTITATAKAGAKSLKINAGDGFNRVTAYASGGDVDILTGSDNDTVKVSVSGTSNSVKVETGAGEDDVTVIDKRRLGAEGRSPQRREHQLQPVSKPE